MSEILHLKLLADPAHNVDSSVHEAALLNVQVESEIKYMQMSLSMLLKPQKYISIDYIL